ncbi:MAG TPA: DUF4446 family protein [Solirubrobacterales bacterium]|jgi:hypothetical protein|nr:DUF4446 family protein [Solirubrobacterales bacterium]
MKAPDGIYDWLALAAGGVALVTLIAAIWLAWSLRRVRRAHRVVIGDDSRDLVAHAEGLQREFLSLRDWLDEATQKLDARMEHAERRLDGSVAHSAMIRYDAYGEMSGRQSSSVALLDSHRNGVVLSAILHRNHSHLYVKQLHRGESDIELSPEEKRAVEEAMSGGGERAAETAQ